MKSKLLSSSLPVLLPIVALILTGCSTQAKLQLDEYAAETGTKVSEKRTDLRNSIVEAEKARIAAQDVDKPFLAGNSTPLARGVAMPEVLRKSLPITALNQRGSVELTTALQQIGEAAGITITATSDALLPASSFAPKTGATNSPIQAPAKVVVMAMNQPLWSVLDDVARQANVFWRPVPGGAEFYRVETRVLYLAAIGQTATTSASLGRNAGQNNVFESQSKTSFESKDQNLVKGIVSSVDAMLTQGGKVTLSLENQTLVVTDTKDSLDRIEAFVKEQNKLMSRRVRVLIEAYEVIDKDNSELGVDWTVLYTTASQVITSQAIGNLTSTAAGSIGLRPGTSDSTGAGSQLLIRALNEVGRVVNKRSFPFLTTSGRPVTQALRTTFNYVDQTQTGSVASSTTTASAPTVTQKDETVGTFVTLVPTAKPDGTIFLSVSFDVTSASPLVPFTVGSGSTAVTVQQKTIDGTGVIQELPIRSGQTVIIGGIETQSSTSNERRLGAGLSMALGGSDTAKVTRSRMVLLVTAVTEEGI